MERYRIQVGQFVVTSEPAELMIFGLGSCVGVFLYQEGIPLGGMAHILLPGPPKSTFLNRSAKFADRAIDLMLEELAQFQARPDRLRAKIGGGASMFSFTHRDDSQTVGQKNVQAVKAKLEACDIPLVGEDVGGDYGRTLIASTQDGSMRIKTVAQGEWTI